jgi:hypothetical protein
MARGNHSMRHDHSQLHLVAAATKSDGAEAIWGYVTSDLMRDPSLTTHSVHPCQLWGWLRRSHELVDRQYGRLYQALSCLIGHVRGLLPG